MFKHKTFFLVSHWNIIESLKLNRRNCKLICFLLNDRALCSRMNIRIIKLQATKQHKAKWKHWLFFAANMLFMLRLFTYVSINKSRDITHALSKLTQWQFLSFIFAENFNFSNAHNFNYSIWKVRLLLNFLYSEDKYRSAWFNLNFWQNV